MREADEEARRVDARLRGEADQAAGALAAGAHGDDEHRVVEIADERVERRLGHAFQRPQHAALALEAERRHRRGAEHELAAAVGREPDPAPAELAQEVRVGEHERVAVGGQRALDHAVGAVGELLERLAARAVVAPHVPARALDADVLGRAPS